MLKIRRSDPKRDFTILPNETLRDDALGYVARGVLAELLSRPDGWQTTADDLSKRARQLRGTRGEGRRLLRNAFAELEEAGYLVRSRERGEGGLFVTVITVYDVPQKHRGTGSGTPVTDVPEAAPRLEGEGAGDADGPEAVPPSIPAPRTEVPDAVRPSEETAGHSEVPDADRPVTGTSVTGTPVTGTPGSGTSIKKTEKKTETKTSGDGRRPSTGSEGGSAGGFAASDKQPASDATPRGIGQVISALPAALTRRLPDPVPGAVVDAIAAELRRGMGLEAMAERIARRWRLHGYDLADDTDGGGTGLLHPVGVAVVLVRRGACTSPRCDDGRDIDDGTDCRTCEREAEDRSHRAQQPLQGAFLTPVPGAAATLPPGRPAAAPSQPMRTCQGCERPSRSLPADGICIDCREDGAAAGSGA
ncbi:hypothetical protein ABZ883_04580 [Streptomyces sp. NPDC046977]|uniref:hypothetical protein n=1 Tax=Streptomyces sp. NPDC046977 TaxID=3154703 RepID=UPI00340C2148